MPSKAYDLEPSNEKHSRTDTFSAPNIQISTLRQESTSNDDIPDRGRWGKSIESLLLCISMSVGLGNVWRFPTVAYQNGGGAFLIPYLLLLFIIGRPLYYLELILGQFSSQGPIKVWRIVPAFKGIGYAQVISVSFVVIFYNYLMALSLYYIFASMQSCLPWTECFYPNMTLNMSTSDNSTVTPSKYFWIKTVLEKNLEDPHAFTSISWRLVLCLLLTWIIVYLAVIQGTSSLGKMSYFTAIFPYLVLTALLIIACREDGAMDGIKLFFVPKFEKLKDINVWYKACEQSFFSLSIGYGNIIMIASYNKFTSNVNRNAIIISVVDTFTNILAGSVIFSVIGTLAHKYGKKVEEMLPTEEYGLAFIVYPEALSKIEYVQWLWSILFFFMLFTLGIGSSMSQIETILTVIKDKFPNLREKKWLLSLCICTLFFALGLPLTTNVGQDILALLNNYGVSAAIFFYATLELVGVAWIYGIKNICTDVKYMLGSTPGIFWKITWTLTAPLALIVIFVYERFAPNEPNPNVEPPPSWAITTGWVLAGFSLSQIPFWFFYVVYRDESVGFWNKLRNSFKANEGWGPSDPIDKAGWIAMKSYGPDKNPVQLATLRTVYENESFRDDIY